MPPLSVLGVVLGTGAAVSVPSVTSDRICIKFTAWTVALLLYFYM
jgi:hypothetical protein